MESNIKIPIFGICLGHQIMGLAAGFQVEKLKYGNRGQNIPCGFVDTNLTHRTIITSQNHGYAIQNNNRADWDELFRNINDNSNEGICHKTKPYFSVQFHPEARGGPEEANFLFDIFRDLIINCNVNIKSLIRNYLNYPKLNQNLKTEGKVLILGSGGLSIGQAGEFDYSGSQAIKAYKECGLEVILINPNVATIQTSKGLADKIYYTPINLGNCSGFPGPLLIKIPAYFSNSLNSIS